ncbi:hypothetical protein OL548_17045 [Lysinibacillus sp. MHQ-1]|nr:hypothetical protein OL548_17045 [Lysinibacillus sp. MHQ-1]
MTLVGFKLEATNDEEFLLARARLRMETAHAQLMVANSSQSLYGGDEPHWIVPADGQPTKVMGKQKNSRSFNAVFAKSINMNCVEKYFYTVFFLFKSGVSFIIYLTVGKKGGL